MSGRDAWRDLVAGPTVAAKPVTSTFKCGHERTPENTLSYMWRYWEIRKCRICHNARNTQWRRAQGIPARAE